MNYPKNYEWLGTLGVLPRCIQEALKLETERYFLYGEGRKYISEKVKEKLDKEEWR